MLAKVNAAMADASASLLERHDVVRGIFQCLLIREHGFLLGPPGTAKSLTVDTIAARVLGANVFKVLMTRYTAPEEVMGPVSLPALQAGKYERHGAGYLPTADIAFLDEVFKANSSILNALLMLANERQYRNGDAMHTSPLMTIIGASNELPQGDDLSALYDRFLLRFFVPYLGDDDSFAALLTLATPAPQATLTMADLQAAQRDVAAVTLSPDIVREFCKLRAELANAGIQRSDRRWRKLANVARAEAWLDGRSSVERSDLAALAPGLWDAPEERGKVAQMVVAFAVPALATALRIYDEAQEQYRAVRDAKSEMERVEPQKKMREYLRPEMDNALRSDPHNPRMKALAQRWEALRRDFGRAVLGA